MTDRKTLEIYDERAAEYARCFSSNDPHRPQLGAFLEDLPSRAHLLDLGCGPGGSAAAMAAAGHTVLATDASAEMIKLAAQHPGVTARQETFDDIAGEAIYDGVWANFSLLHAARADLPRHLAAIAQALKPGGLFSIGMKTGTGTDRDGIGRRYTFVTEDELRALLRDAGLTPLRDWSGIDPGLAGTHDPWIVIQARKDG